MATPGKVHVREIEANPIELSVKESEPWVRAMLERSAPPKDLSGLEASEWAGRCEYEAQLKLEKVAQEYGVSGSFRALVPVLCSTCATAFRAKRGGPFQLFFKTFGRYEQKDPDSGDPDYVFLNSETIDLIEILAEQLIVQEPIAERCAQCERQRGGENLSISAGQAGERRANSPFYDLKEKLQNLSLTSDNRSRTKKKK